MENNKSYLDRIPLVFLLIVAALGLQEMFLLLPSPTKQGNLRISYIVNEIVNIFIVFVPLALAFNKWTKAWWCIGASILGTIGSALIWDNFIDFNKDHTATNFLYIALQLLFVLINLFFFLDKKLPAKRIWLILAALVIFRGASVIFYANAGSFDLLHKVLGSGFQKYAGMLVMMCFCITKFIYYSELQNFADGKAPVWSIRLLNPANSYKKLSATIVFWALKTFLYLLIFGLGYLVTRYSNPFRYESLKISSVFDMMSMFNAFLSIGVGMMAAWWLRKFLLEYFISHGITSKVAYWLLLFPVIGTITWIVLLQEEKTDNAEKRVSNIGEFAAAETTGISATYFVLMGILLLLNVTKTGSIGGAFSMVLAMLMFAWFIKDRSAYYFNFYLNIALYATILIWFFSADFRENKLFAILYPLAIYNLVMLIVILPVYHFSDFTYILPEEPAETPVEGKDLLPEFQ